VSVPVLTRQQVEEKAALVEELLTKGAHAGGHHPNCATRTDEGCDCYARATAPARAALATLVESHRQQGEDTAEMNEHYFRLQNEAEDAHRHVGELEAALRELLRRNTDSATICRARAVLAGTQEAKP
jgi:hypothetical protein